MYSGYSFISSDSIINENSIYIETNLNSELILNTTNIPKDTSQYLFVTDIFNRTSNNYLNISFTNLIETTSEISLGKSLNVFPGILIVSQ